MRSVEGKNKPEITMIRNISNTRTEVISALNDRSATIHLVQSSRFARRLASLLLVGLVVSIFAMMFLPWQQTSRGTGQVIAFVPQERQQSIEAPTKGVVARIASGLVEGSEVKKGDFILELQPFAANMAEQLDGQLKDLKAKLDTANAKANAYAQNVDDFTEAREYAVQAATDMVDATKSKLLSKQKQIAGYEAKQLQAKLNYDRQLGLSQKGYKPKREIEKLKKEWDVATAELNSVHEQVEALKKEVQAKKAELHEKRLVAQTKVDKATAFQEDAKGSALTISKEIRDLEIKLGEMQRLTILAPRDGTIFRMPVFELGDAIKAGDPILTLIPETSQKAVELMVRGNDMPLVQEGQEVRLQFEGWPAVQFAGWPSVAVGTFSGIVSTVDATDNGQGEFRILVSPNPDSEPWPSDRYLRQGVRANGWVMMREVSLGYEMWRQLNGFPIIVAENEPKTGKTQSPKLPK